MTSVSDAERLRARERPRAWSVMRQTWRHLGFLHWSVDVAALAAMLPPGLELDVFRGQAFVGLVPFTIAGSRLVGTPPLPGLSAFHEINLRTYVHVGGRDPGVWFFCLDAASRAAVWAARRTYKLPYHHAAMAMTVAANDRVAYRSRRLEAGAPASFAGTYFPVGPAAAAPPGSLEFFLAERYVLYSWDGARLRRARVWHPPYPLQPARVETLAQTVTSAAGIRLPAEPPALVHVAGEVSVRIYPPRVVDVEAGAGAGDPAGDGAGT